MLTYIKEIIKKITLPLIYIGSIFVIFKTAFKEAKWGLYLLIYLIPQPNIWHKLFDFPGGKDVLDFLVLSILLGIMIQGKGFAKSRNSLFIMILILVSYLSLWNSSLRYSLPLPISTSNYLLEGWKDYARMVILYFLALNVLKYEKEQENLIMIISFVILIMAIRSYRNFDGGASFSYDKRDSGPFWPVGLGANHYGAFLAYYGSFLAGLGFFIKDKKKKYLYILSSLISIPALLFTYSRGAYLAILASISFFSMKKRILLIIILAILFSWQSILPVSVVDRITMTHDSSGKLEDSAGHRVILWKYAVDLFNESPIFGVGYKGFSINMPPGELKDTHNYYMLMICEQGLVGIILFVITLLKAFNSGWSLFRIGQSDFSKGLGFGFMGCVITCIVANIFGDRWSYFTLGGYFWILWGLVDRSLLITRSRLNKEND